MRHLFSAFTEMGYLIKRIHAVPDFVCDGALGTLAVEAMTVNPTQGRTGAGVPPPPLGTAEEQRAFVGTVRELAQGEFRSRALKYMDGTFPWENIKQLAELGILGMAVPQEYGGSGMGVLDTALVLEEIA